MRSLPFALLLAGCSSTMPGTPIDFAGLRVVLLCMVNCPVTAMLADEGQTTDTLPQEYPRLDPGNLRTVRTR